MIAIETKSLRSRNGKLLSPAAEAERSIIKKFRKTIWNPFVGGIKDYHLIQEGDAIAVCISGGKDSMLLAKCMQHLQKYSEIPLFRAVPGDGSRLYPAEPPENRGQCRPA